MRGESFDEALQWWNAISFFVKMKLSADISSSEQIIDISERIPSIDTSDDQDQLADKDLKDKVSVEQKNVTVSSAQAPDAPRKSVSFKETVIKTETTLVRKNTLGSKAKSLFTRSTTK